MTTFSYKAKEQTGKTVVGIVEALNHAIALEKVAEIGYIPISVKKTTFLTVTEKITSLKNCFNKVPFYDLILLTRQFATMIHAGVPMLNLLQILEQQTENHKLQQIVATLHKDISNGENMYNSFAKHPSVFSPLYCSMVKAGEESGALDEVLKSLISLLEHENRVKAEIKSALRYPIIVLAFLTIAFVVLLTFVIPKFVNVFKQNHIDIPLPTQICIALSNFACQYWLLILIAGTIIWIASSFALKTPKGNMLKDSYILKIPILGSLLLKSAISRFANIFAILQKSGVGILQSLEILAGTIGNVAIAKEFKKVKILLQEGKGIARPLKDVKYFPVLLTNMVAIGEETGNLEEMLMEVSTHYDVELEYSMKKMADAIPAILTIGMAIIVGFFALAIYLPMWDLVKLVK